MNSPRMRLSSQSEIAAYAKEKLGERLEVNLAPLRHSPGQMTAWRMEGTLREFAPMPPRCFWFRHPFHTMDQSETLTDAKAEGEEPAWKAQAEAKKEAKVKERLDRSENMALAFNTLNLGGDVPLAGLVKQSKLEGLLTKDGKPTEVVPGPTGRLGSEALPRWKCSSGGRLGSVESENPGSAEAKKSRIDMAEKLAQNTPGHLETAAEDAQASPG